MIGQRIYSGTAFEEMAGYSRAVVDRDMVYVSGTVGIDPDTKELPEGVEAQAENCFKVITRALTQAGTSLDNLLRVRIFVSSRPEFQAIIPIIKKYCDAARPANTAVICELVDEKMRVEVEVTAKRIERESEGR